MISRLIVFDKLLTFCPRTALQNRRKTHFILPNYWLSVLRLFCNFFYFLSSDCSTEPSKNTLYFAKLLTFCPQSALQTRRKKKTLFCQIFDFLSSDCSTDSPKDRFTVRGRRKAMQCIGSQRFLSPVAQPFDISTIHMTYRWTDRLAPRATVEDISRPCNAESLAFSK